MLSYNKWTTATWDELADDGGQHIRTSDMEAGDWR
jgi:hypothetical protein